MRLSDEELAYLLRLRARTNQEPCIMDLPRLGSKTPEVDCFIKLRPPVARQSTPAVPKPSVKDRVKVAATRVLASAKRGRKPKTTITRCPPPPPPSRIPSTPQVRPNLSQEPHKAMGGPLAIPANNYYEQVSSGVVPTPWETNLNHHRDMSQMDYSYHNSNLDAYGSDYQNCEYYSQGVPVQQIHPPTEVIPLPVTTATGASWLSYGTNPTYSTLSTPFQSLELPYTLPSLTSSTPFQSSPLGLVIQKPPPNPEVAGPMVQKTYKRPAKSKNASQGSIAKNKKSRSCAPKAGSLSGGETYSFPT